VQSITGPVIKKLDAGKSVRHPDPADSAPAASLGLSLEAGFSRRTDLGYPEFGGGVSAFVEQKLSTNDTAKFPR